MARTLSIFAVAAALTLTAWLLGPVGPAAPPAPAPAVVDAPPAPPAPVEPPSLGPPATPRASDGTRLRLTGALSHGELPAGPGAPVYLLAEVEARGRPHPIRRDLNLALVLDRSGSMAGPKLEKAKEAARTLVRRLGPGDRVSLIAYGSSVSLLAKQVPGTAAGRRELLRAIDRIEDLGGTFLSGGLEAARRALRGGPGLRRVILLSDGEANEGIVSPGGLRRLAEQMASDGISISALGVGTEFDEDVLLALADRSGGRYSFLRRPDELVAAMGRELSAAQATVGRDVALRIAPEPGVRVRRVYGWEAASDGAARVVRLPDLAAGDRIRVVVALDREAFPEGHRPLVRVRLTWAGAQGEAGLAGIDLSTRVRTAADPAAEDREVLEAAARAAAAEDLSEAAHLYETGRVTDARELMRRRIQAVLRESRRLGSDALEGQARTLDREAAFPAAAPDSDALRGTVKTLKARALELSR